MSERLEIILVLLAAVAALALLARRIHLPYTLVLVVAGLGLGWIPGLHKIGLPPELFLQYLLPALIYPAALFTPWRDFRANLEPISLLAIGLVLFTMLGVGFMARAVLPELPLAAAFVLGAIVSPTDPLAATAIAQRMNVPQRIQRVLEGESLLNDASGLVGYRIAVGAVVSGSFSLATTGLEFLRMAGGGILFGLGVGWLVAQIQRRIDDPPIEITISLLTPFAAALPAERLGLSGVLAVVTAGLYLGWRSPLLHKAQMRLQAAPIWEMLQFILNGLVFLLIGLELPEILRGIQGASALKLVWEGAWIGAAVIVIRLVWVFPVAYLPGLVSVCVRARGPFPDWRRVALVGWTGMRGAVSLAAALGLPHVLRDGRPFPGRNQILFLTYCVILATLVAQGLTLPRVIRWLGVTGGGETEKEEREARLKANEAVLARLDELAGKEPQEVLEKVRAEYNERLRQFEASEQGQAQAQRGNGSAYRRLKQEALDIERRTLLELRNQHIINDEVLRRIQHDLDLAESRLSRMEQR